MTEPSGISPRRLFVAVWLCIVLVTATNITREHYPAFALVDGSGFACDRYAGFHSDIFRHTDGRWYINNNIGASTLAAIPLWVFSPVLDAVERHSKARLRSIGDAGSKVDVSYNTPWPNREKMYRLARERGLDLRFGVATLILALFLNAPLAGAAALAVRKWCLGRGLGAGAAAVVGFAFIVATPVLYRSATLNHNLLVAWATLGAFACLERRRDGFDASAATLLAAGFFSGAAVLFDYSGCVTALWAGVVVLARSGSTTSERLRAAGLFIAGALPPIAVQLVAQFVCFGNPWLPPAHWMGATAFSDRGFHGFDLPSPDLLAANLFDLRFGLLPYAPLLVLGFLPPPKNGWLGRDVWLRGLALVAGYLVFASANQFARMQWNTGFRYLCPALLPLWIGAAAHLWSFRPSVRRVLLVLAALHAFATTTSRTLNVVDDWDRLAGGAFRLPWVDTLARTASGKDLSAAIAAGGWISPESAHAFLVGPWPSVVATTVVAWICWRLFRPQPAYDVRN